MRNVILGPLAAACFILGLAPLVLANETQAPVASKRHVSSSETHTLNPQPIPPGKSARAPKMSKPGQEKSIIFVGGKKVVAKPTTQDVVPGFGKPSGSTKPRTAPGPAT